MAEETFDMFDEDGTEIVAPSTKPNGETSKETLLDILEIAVSDPEKQVKTSGGLKMQDTYVAYQVESKPRDVKDVDPKFDEVSSVWRRYSEFELLRNYLTVSYPAIVMPPLPEKRANFIWTKIATDTFDPEFLERRRVGLEHFLHRICSHLTMCRDDIVVAFLKQEESWRETVMASGYQSKADSWLKTLNASWRVKQPDQSFEDLKVCASELHTNIAAVLKARAKLADRVYGLYKIHANYSRIFKDWSNIENESMAEALRKACREIDRLSNSIDTLMDEEELYAEQLKEYFYFTDSIKAVVKKHESMQYDVEYLENQLMSAHIEKKQIETGTERGFLLGGMKAKLFGSDTPDQREAKIAKVNETIKKLEDLADEKRATAKSFTSEAKKEVKRFKLEKQVNLKEILTSYVILQIKVAKETKAIWTRLRAIMQSI